MLANYVEKSGRLNIINLTFLSKIMISFSLFLLAKPLELLSCNLVKKKDPVQTDSPCIFF